ncbi:hypothetical protein PPACK8108_LOCUS2812 [Phakopsora pachyrhizi]|uniref:Uncharacterized protein n=1 Tax=Phakopsora pachyrhizi TaxID=170000 RepID=A0AAV0ALE1_PHAPC|nr:hypothetical protein PPACK8108_LOCUS2812 [Phakopsora pachyrhizi]
MELCTCPRCKMHVIIDKMVKSSNNLDKKGCEISSGSEADLVEYKNMMIVCLIQNFIMWLYLACDMIVENVEKVSESAGININLNSLHLKVEPSLDHHICCPKCYLLYNTKTAPLECDYQSTVYGAQYSTNLFRNHKLIDLCHNETFVQQNIGTTFEGNIQKGFISPRDLFVENSIDSWAQLSTQNLSKACDVSQGMIWRELSLQNNTDNQVNIELSLFIDWFNPLGNKISGQQISIGVMALNCLNLPLFTFQPFYNCLIGIIPAPKQPDIITINNILSKFVDKLFVLGKGIILKTQKYPKGHNVVVKLAALIGDILANHKVAGFMSHSARKFCSWCSKVLEVSYEWKGLTSVKERQNLAKKTCICWSELNCVPYWDTVKNLPLGVMHNWYEVGFELNDAKRSKSTQVSQTDSSEANSDAMDMSGSQTGKHWYSKKYYLSNSFKTKMRKWIQEVVVPKELNDKLKATELGALFSIYLPLAALAAAWDDSSFSDHQPILMNMGALFKCTKIVGATEVTKDDICMFSKTYQSTSMHISEQLKLWGPLMGVSECGGEHLIGTLQKFNTNSLTGAIEETMMKKFWQMQMLQVRKLLMPEQTKKRNALFCKRLELDEGLYKNLLKDYQHLPQPASACIMRNYAKELDSATWKLGMNISKSAPNNFFQFKINQNLVYSKISHALDLECKELLVRELLVVQILEQVQDRANGYELVDASLDVFELVHVVPISSYICF